MKKFLREKFVEPILRKMALEMLKKHKPEIIAITGSFGKTSTKDAVALVLGSRFEVLAAPHSYNTKIGGPLTVFNQKLPPKITSIFGWLRIIFASLGKLFFDRHYPKILVMELGIDRPGEMAYYLSFVKPKIGIVTAVGPVHLEKLGNVKTVAYEKGLLVEALDKEGIAILNYDDFNVRAMKSRTEARVLTYGFSRSADIWASNVVMNKFGLSFKIHYQDQVISFINLPVLAEHFIYSLMPAVLCGLLYGMDSKEIEKALRRWRPPKGRMNIIPGINDSVIIDDSYNANPSSMLKALEVLERFRGRKIAALGTMNELGSFEEEGHRQVGRKAAEVADLLICVGEPAQRYLATQANECGLPSSAIFCFKDSIEAGKFLRGKIKKGDIILAKGSQNNVRMEWLVELIMKNPQEAKLLLVRQGRSWNKPQKLEAIKRQMM